MEFLKYLVSILVITDPIFAAILVAGLVDAKEVKTVAFKSSLTVFIAAMVTLLIGDGLLKLLGINLYSIKIFGGLLLLQMAFQMIQARAPKAKHTEEESKAATEKEDISIIPIGIPVLFGPGAFTTILIFKEEATHFCSFLLLFLAILISTGVIYFIIRNSVHLAKRMGTTGVNVTVRIFGLFVGALGSQFIVDGVKHLWLQG